MNSSVREPEVSSREENVKNFLHNKNDDAFLLKVYGSHNMLSFKKYIKTNEIHLDSE